MFNLIFLGDPASGKATQSQKIAKKYNMLNIDFGKELVKIQHSKSKNSEYLKIRKAIKATSDKGKIFPTAFARRFFKEQIFSAPKNKGILFDGNPKMLGEAKLVHKWLNAVGRNDGAVLVLYLSIPRREIIKRMLKRKELVGGKHIKRKDDNIAALKNRLSFFSQHMPKVLDFLGSKYEFKKVGGLGSREEVYNKIEGHIHEFIKKQGRNK